jgi:Spy/CpxP family protein refolding chaperone
MTNPDTQSSGPAPQPSAPRRSRTRSVLLASALLLSGGVIGAVVAGPVWSQGGPHGWDRGYDSDYGPRYGSPRGYDRDGDYGRHGQRYGGDYERRGRYRGDADRYSRSEGRRTGMSQGPRGPFAGRFGPGMIERRVDGALRSVDATPEQRQKVKAIFEKTADELYAVRTKRLEGRKQIREALAAATIDKTRIEALRVEQMKAADEASKVFTNAITAAAEVLTPEQRVELARKIERHRRWFRG